MNNAESFATSLVSLALVRSGYATSKHVRYGDSLRADILAVRDVHAQPAEAFVVQVKAIRDRHAVPARLDELRTEYAVRFGMSVYLAFFADSDQLLLVDPELGRRMRFSDEEVRLEAIAQDVGVATATPL